MGVCLDCGLIVDTGWARGGAGFSSRGGGTNGFRVTVQFQIPQARLYRVVWQ